eukprot:8083686-Lingulodinium_polyedra.AAC.1
MGGSPPSVARRANQACQLNNGGRATTPSRTASKRVPGYPTTSWAASWMGPPTAGPPGPALLPGCV